MLELSEQSANTMVSVCNAAMVVLGVFGLVVGICSFWGGAYKEKYASIKEEKTQEELAAAHRIAKEASDRAAMLDKRTAGRRLSAEQISKIGNLLATHPDGRVDIEVDRTVPDANALAEDIKQALASGGINVAFVSGVIGLGPGVSIGVFGEDKALADQILAAFLQADLEARSGHGNHRVPEGTVTIRVGGPAPTPPVSEFRLSN